MVNCNAATNVSVSSWITVCHNRDLDAADDTKMNHVYNSPDDDSFKLYLGRRGDE